MNKQNSFSLTKLTDNEQTQLDSAAEFIAQEGGFSCNAVGRLGSWWLLQCYQSGLALHERGQQFENDDSYTYEEKQTARILMILMFKESLL